jgi:apolipoprotein N-acyltransferase
LSRSLDEYLQLSVENLPDNINLVVWPETAIPARFDRVESYIEPTVSALESRDVDVLAGGFERAGQASYNAVKQLGGAQQTYRKRHLVPFGEYIPLRGFIELFSEFIQIPGTDIARGEGPHVPLNVAGELIGVSICYEDAFGEEGSAALFHGTGQCIKRCVVW